MGTYTKNALALGLSWALLGTLAFGQIGRKSSLTLEGAKKVAAAAEAEARKNQVGGAIAVVDDGGNLMYLVRLDGTFAAGAQVSIGKARTAALFKRPTKFFEDVVNKGRFTMVALEDFTPLQGGVPLTVDGEIVGGIGVSGAASAQQDEEIALAGAGALSGENASMKSSQSLDGVFYQDRDAVAKAFQKEAPLIEVADYKVHASHRDKGGEAEIHEGERDIIYVLQGAATFVTGGSVLEARSISPGEIRGRGIEGGESRHLRKGDVVIVPKGIPHWFEKVGGIINYYVVKVL